ncbi:MAG TPA: peptide deformylase, partial [Thermoanaerobaculia bacterium]|nr:peptide deformylase [Thermoanaerobaculia bacterium]
MAVLPIVKYGDEVLRTPTEPVGAIDDSIQKLIDDMVETMYAAPGVGLAANQVGVSKRLMVIDLSVGKRPGELHVCINPEVVEVEGDI